MEYREIFKGNDVITRAVLFVWTKFTYFGQSMSLKGSHCILPCIVQSNSLCASLPKSKTHSLGGGGGMLNLAIMF